MATARKLKSGSWRVLVYDYTDEDGKRKYKSFTAPTKKQAELAAAQYNASEKQSRTNITVRDALERYITAKDGVLSPSTIKGYRQMQKADYGQIESVDVYRLTTERMQQFVTSLVNEGKSPKTVANIYGLLSSSVTMFRPDVVFHVSLPKRSKRKKDAPSDAQVQQLFSAADGELKVSIALAAFGGLRRGEICALRYEDVTGNVISVHADMVQDSEYQFHYKDIPKTSDSIRLVTVPDGVIELLGQGRPDEFIVKSNPNMITHRFIYLRDKLNLDIRFHDMRHYFASIGAALNIPDIYLSDFGGWGRNSSIMRSVYQNILDAEKVKHQETLTNYFSKIMQHEMQHE